MTEEKKNKEPSTEELLKLLEGPDLFEVYCGVFVDVAFGQQEPLTIKRSEILAINSSLRRLYDIFFFLFFLYFNECLPDLNANQDIKTAISKHNFKLIRKLLS